MLMDTLIEYGDNYSETSGRFWQFYRDEPALTDVISVDTFPVNSASFKFKQKITEKPGNNDAKDVEIMVPLKYLSHFWRELETLLIDCKVNLILTYSANIFLVAKIDNSLVPKFAIPDTKLPIVTMFVSSIVTLFRL